MNLYKTCNAKPYTFLVIDPLHFRKNLLQRTKKLIMTIDDKIRDENLQQNINREASKISAQLSGKIDKYENLTGKEILPSTWSQKEEQANFTYSPSGKALALFYVIMVMRICLFKEL